MQQPFTAQFSTHFKRAEFEEGELIPEPCLPIFKALCEQILEPIREHIEKPVVITSGYRSPEHNRSIGGAYGSQHIATAEQCACDFKVEGADLRELFRWIRLDSGLPFDQVILETERWDGPPACIHISYGSTGVRKPRRMALEGLTHGRGRYIARATEAFPPHYITAEELGSGV